MQVLCVEVRANHDDPESCVGIRHARQRARQVLLQRPAHSLRTSDLAKAGDVAGNVDDRVETAGIGEGKPITLLLTEGQMYDHKGARLMLGALPSASTLIADRGYNSNWFHAALADKGIPLCIPPTKSRKHPIDTTIRPSLASAIGSKPWLPS